MIGRVVGKYKILDQIGEGGMGIVYRAEHVVLGGPAAIKVLLPQFTRDAIVVDRFFHEAKATSAIRHVGIVQVFDYGRLANEQAYIAMELLRGEELTGFIDRHGIVEPAVAAQIALQMLSALEAAHLIGVVHRDLKPDNIFLVRDASAPGGIRVKILDFGIAKLIGDPIGRGAPRLKTKGGAILGTPAYMAPEQCRGGVEIDARADLYAVGCILFEMLTGRPPFIAEGGGETMAMHIYEPPPRLRDRAPNLPLELDTVIAKMLAKAPDERTPSAAWALAALERVSLEPLPAEIPLLGRPVTAPALAEPVDPASRWLPIVVIAIAIVIAAAAAYVIGMS
ncbi:MAG: serine/threonine protein kinase [Deltaproteobacteria bacterium]|nr:serine/threonine protein kinase [Deltaproteobacteria bacterium]MDQ3295737.1 serine/threonine protein kinase [Myxococcota bacterium]